MDDDAALQKAMALYLKRGDWWRRSVYVHGRGTRVGFLFKPLSDTGLQSEKSGFWRTRAGLEARPAETAES